MRQFVLLTSLMLCLFTVSGFTDDIKTSESVYKKILIIPFANNEFEAKHQTYSRNNKISVNTLRDEVRTRFCKALVASNPLTFILPATGDSLVAAFERSDRLGESKNNKGKKYVALKRDAEAQEYITALKESYEVDIVMVMNFYRVKQEHKMVGTNGGGTFTHVHSISYDLFGWNGRHLYGKRIAKEVNQGLSKVDKGLAKMAKLLVRDIMENFGWQYN